MTKIVLSGPSAFYRSNDYECTLKKSLLEKSSPKPCYKIELENRILRIAKRVLSYVLFPIAIYQYLHSYAGKYQLLKMGCDREYQLLHGKSIDDKRLDMMSDPHWKVKRLAIEVDGFIIDAAIMGTEATLGNGRWLMHTCGSDSSYESVMGQVDPANPQKDIKNLLKEIDANMISFNYSGIGASTGAPSASAMIKAYKACLRFLEDQDRGLAAKEIITHSRSLGGGVEGEVLKTHEFQDDIKYVCIKDKTFESVSKAAYYLFQNATGIFLSALIKIFGWDFSPFPYRKLDIANVKEIIIQSSIYADYVSITNRENLDVFKYDGSIPPKASLARAILADRNISLKNKVILGVPDNHYSGFSNIPILASCIKHLLANTIDSEPSYHRNF